MFKNYFSPFSQISSILQNTYQMIQTDKENFTHITFSGVKDMSFSPLLFANALYMEIHYKGSYDKAKSIAKQYHSFTVAKTFHQEISFDCFIEFSFKANLSQFKSELNKISLFNEKATFSGYHIFIQL